jgi:hypothetical protein
MPGLDKKKSQASYFHFQRFVKGLVPSDLEAGWSKHYQRLVPGCTEN